MDLIGCLLKDTAYETILRSFQTMPKTDYKIPP